MGATGGRDFDQRIKEFAHSYTREVENRFHVLFGHVDQCPQPQRANSTAVNIVSGLAQIGIPHLGKTIARALKALDIFIKEKIDKGDAERLANLVYFFDDNSVAVRKMLIEAAIEICMCFEPQFRLAALQGENPRSVMRELGKEAAKRTLAYFLEVKPDQVSRDDFTRAVISGEKVNGMFSVKKMKNPFNEKWTLDSIIKKSAIVTKNSQYFSGANTDDQTYGFRRLFSWEEAPETWVAAAAPAGIQHDLKPEHLEELYTVCLLYIMTKNSDDAAQLDRDIKHRQSSNDRQDKHEKLLKQSKEENAQLVETVQKGQDEIMTEVRAQGAMGSMRQQGERRQTELRCDQYGRKMKVIQTNDNNGIVTIQWESEEDMKNVVLRQF